MYCCVEPEAGAMVPTSHFVVEDYILYKIRGKFSQFARTPIVQLDSSSKKIIQALPLSSETRRPTDLNISLRNLALEYERRYESNFPDLLKEMKTTIVSPDNVANTLRRLSHMLFRLPLKPIVQQASDNSEVITEQANYNVYGNDGRSIAYDDNHIKWGHIIALLVFAGVLAVHAVEMDCLEEVDIIINWVSTFFDTQLSGWLNKNGGWNTLIQWNAAARNGNVMNAYDDYDSADNISIKSVMSVGVLAACVGFGAMIMARK